MGPGNLRGLFSYAFAPEVNYESIDVDCIKMFYRDTGDPAEAVDPFAPRIVVPSGVLRFRKGVAMHRNEFLDRHRRFTGDSRDDFVRAGEQRQKCRQFSHLALQKLRDGGQKM